MSGLTRPEIYKVVEGYIGVSGGYLGDFSYRTHADFYPYYCDLDIDPNEYEGTTRTRFLTILESASPLDQAKILRGVLTRFPPSSTPERSRLAPDINRMIQRLEGAVVPSISLAESSKVAESALLDAEALLRTNGPSSAIDRIHTAVHAYLLDLCRDAGLQPSQSDGITALFKQVRENHPAFRDLGRFEGEIVRIVRSFGGVLESLNTLRNLGGNVHPTEQRVERAEAELAINSARTLLHYLRSKVAESGVPTRRT